MYVDSSCEHTYLFDIESRANINDHAVRVGKLALDVEGVGEGDEDVFVVW